MSTIIALLFSFSTTTLSGLLTSIIWSHWMVISHKMLHFFTFRYPFRLMLIPFLTSAHVILTTEFPVDQSGNNVVSFLVLFLCQHLTLIENVVYCFTLLATHPTKQGIYLLLNVELNIFCSQCLFLSCKNMGFSFNFQVIFPSPLLGLIVINHVWHFPQKLTTHFFLSIYLSWHSACSF